MVDAYVRQTSGRPSGLFEELGDRTIIGPADETRLCIFERGPGGKLERAEDRCVPKTETGDEGHFACQCAQNDIFDDGTRDREPCLCANSITKRPGTNQLAAPMRSCFLSAPGHTGRVTAPQRPNQPFRATQRRQRLGRWSLQYKLHLLLLLYYVKYRDLVKLGVPVLRQGRKQAKSTRAF